MVEQSNCIRRGHRLEKDGEKQGKKLQIRPGEKRDGDTKISLKVTGKGCAKGMSFVSIRLTGGGSSKNVMLEVADQTKCKSKKVTRETKIEKEDSLSDGRLLIRFTRGGEKVV